MRTSFILLRTVLPPIKGIESSKGPLAFTILHLLRKVDFRKFSSLSIVICVKELSPKKVETGGRYTVLRSRIVDENSPFEGRVRGDVYRGRESTSKPFSPFSFPVKQPSQL